MTPDAPEELRDRWIRLLDRSRGELTKVYKYRTVYEEVGQIIAHNRTLPDSEFFELIQTGYVCWQALIVRRQVDWKDDRVECLGRVLHEMIENPNEAFAAGFDVAAVDADAKRLYNETQTVRDYVDKILAHSDRHPAELPTLKDVHDAVDRVLTTFHRTYAKLTGEHWAIELVAIQYDWQAVFLQPWLVRA